jgi:hypothetical protein
MPRININRGIFVLVSSLAHCTMRENNSHYWKNVKVWNNLMSKLILFISNILPHVFSSVFEYLAYCNCYYNLVSNLVMEVSCIEKCLHNSKKKAPSSVEVKNGWNYTFTPPYASWRAQKLMQ